MKMMKAKDVTLDFCCSVQCCAPQFSRSQSLCCPLKVNRRGGGGGVIVVRSTVCFCVQVPDKRKTYRFSKLQESMLSEDCVFRAIVPAAAVSSVVVPQSCSFAHAGNSDSNPFGWFMFGIP